MKTILQKLLRIFLIICCVLIVISGFIRVFEGHYIFGVLKILFGLFMLIVFWTDKNASNFW